MAVSVEGGGKGRRKAVDADLNLVPYIDLLTCTVAFLLITAVWSQLARLEVAQKGQGREVETDTNHTRIAVLVSADGFNLFVADDQKPIPKRGNVLDYARLSDELEAAKKGHPDYPEFSNTGTRREKCPECDKEQHRAARAKKKA